MKDFRYNKKGILLSEYKKIMCGGQSSFSNQRAKLNIPLPNNAKELEIVSEYIFGTPLHLSRLDVYEGASYEVKEYHNDYYDNKFNMASHNSCYEVDAFFWKTIIGGLRCGGIGGHSYGQTEIIGYRNKKRLQRLSFSLRNEGANYIRKPFARLAEHIRVRREQK